MEIWKTKKSKFGRIDSFSNPTFFLVSAWKRSDLSRFNPLGESLHLIQLMSASMCVCVRVRVCMCVCVYVCVCDAMKLAYFFIIIFVIGDRVETNNWPLDCKSLRLSYEQILRWIVVEVDRLIFLSILHFVVPHSMFIYNNDFFSWFESSWSKC